MLFLTPLAACCCCRRCRAACPGVLRCHCSLRATAARRGGTRRVLSFGARGVLGKPSVKRGSEQRRSRTARMCACGTSSIAPMRNHSKKGHVQRAHAAHRRRSSCVSGASARAVRAASAASAAGRTASAAGWPLLVPLLLRACARSRANKILRK